MSEPSTQSAEIVYSPVLAKRIARNMINKTKKEGVESVYPLAYALSYTPELDALVAKEIRIYKRYNPIVKGPVK
jgi:hypothetical protein